MFNKYGLTLNPDKCEFGVEFIGHLIDFEGLRFLDSKLEGVRDLQIPQTKKALKSFLGLANFFRDHVHHHSIIALP
jgi:hypothetical protein